MQQLSPKELVMTSLQQLPKHYQNPELTKQDILRALMDYHSLIPKWDKYLWDAGKTQDLLCLAGTIPVPYKGNTYNIPVCIWLQEAHPYNAPVCYVKPTDAMEIKISQHVDHRGKIYLTYLHNWKHTSSDLNGLIEVMVVVFSEHPPVYAKRQSPCSSPSDIALPQASNSESLLQLLQHYNNPDITKKDILDTLLQYKGLVPKRDTFVFDTGEEKDLVCLDGTIPVPYKGNTYNIPICVWLLESHPDVAPICYLKPTGDMVIRQSQSVDETGKIDLTYLRNWKLAPSNLLGLIQVMVVVFSEFPPLASLNCCSNYKFM